jgi:flavodoxin
MKSLLITSVLLLAMAISACGEMQPEISAGNKSDMGVAVETEFTTNTSIEDVKNDPVFDGYGELIFPVDSGYTSGDTLGELRLTWYNNIVPEKTVEIANYLRDHAAAGETVFYDIYTEEEKAAAPDKADTGLFFFTLGADIFRIEPETPYPTDHEVLVDLALEEQNDNVRPAIKDSIEDLEQYDTVFLGYPNWWGDMPMILYSFLEEYDFGGKTIIPFNTHGGSGFSGTISSIREEQPNAEVMDGLSISRNRIQDAEQDIIDWVNGLELQ